MGNNSSNSNLDIYNNTKKLTLEEFDKETHRKMNLHILSNERNSCIDFIKHFTNENVKDNSSELLEKDIHKKVNLYSFMNYKIYYKVSSLINEIKNIFKNVLSNLLNEFNYSEIIVILDNVSIEKQIETIRDDFEKDKDFHKFYFPFLIVISPKEIDLKGFEKLKTFHYKITFEDIVNYNKKKFVEKIEKEEIEKKNKKNEEILCFFRRLNVLFSYYNELGDEFSFMNSEKEEKLYEIEQDIDNNDFINILFLGKGGVGKSTLINLILEEKKSLEGIGAISTTSKNILVYKKKGVPLRLYDSKGIENQEIVDNYDKIIEDFNPNNPSCKDTIHAIFYLINYNGIIEIDFKLFEKFYKYKFPVIFIITKTPYDISERAKKRQEIERKRVDHAIKMSIKDKIKDSFKNAIEYIDKYTKIHFVNLIHTDTSHVFGIDKILSFFTDLEKYCNEKKEKEYKEPGKNNPSLKIISEFDAIKIRNEIKAENYISETCTGTVPV